MKEMEKIRKLEEEKKSRREKYILFYSLQEMIFSATTKIVAKESKSLL